MIKVSLRTEFELMWKIEDTNFSDHYIGDIKDFVNLNNNNDIMDLKFAFVKTSIYGHIG